MNLVDNDPGYKRLFSHPEMAADLLRGFVHEPWVRELDLRARAKNSPFWHLIFEMEKGEVDITVMRIIVDGELDGTRQRWVYDLLDRYNPTTKTHSMAHDRVHGNRCRRSARCRALRPTGHLAA